MKNIIKIIATSMVVFLFIASCNDSFLDRYPKNDISDANYWKTPNDLQMFCNTWYSNNSLLPTYQSYNLGAFAIDAGDYPSLNFASSQSGSDIQAGNNYIKRMNGEYVVPSDGDGWGTSDWSVLRQINYFMDNYKKVEELNSFDAVKRYVGEALFFRSLFYFKKLQRYGALPWAATTVAVDSEVLFGERLPRNQVVDNIMADMDKAVEYLPAQANGTWTGRITKETAMALQSRIALYEGTWEKYHKGTAFAAAVDQSTKFLQKAADVSDALMKMSESAGFPALDGVGKKDAAGNLIGYRDLFNQTTYATNKEVIFWRRFVAGLVTGHGGAYSHMGGQVGATKNMIDSYLKIDGTPVAAGYDDSNLIKVAEGRDPRLTQSININDGLHYRFSNASPPTFFIAPQLDDASGEMICPTGYQIYKGHIFLRVREPQRGDADNALIYFRFGEVLLNFAEAKAELGTITQGDLDRSINKLRARAGMPNLTLAGLTIDPNFEFKTLAPIIQEVRRERKVELAFEGFRHHDIMRWAAAGELIVGKIPVGAKKAQWEGFKFADHAYDQTQNGRQTAFDLTIAGLETDAQGYIKIYKKALNEGTAGFKFNVNRDYLFPIPSGQLSLNEKLKPQNPGW